MDLSATVELCLQLNVEINMILILMCGDNKDNGMDPEPFISVNAAPVYNVYKLFPSKIVRLQLASFQQGENL